MRFLLGFYVGLWVFLGSLEWFFKDNLMQISC